MTMGTLYSPLALRLGNKLGAGGSVAIRLLLTCCLAFGQLLPNGAQAQERGRTMISADCIRTMGYTDEGRRIFGLIGLQPFAKEDDGTLLFSLPSECLVSTAKEPTPLPMPIAGPGMDTTDTARAMTENMASGLGENGADPETLEKAEGLVQRNIDRTRSQQGAAQSLQQASVAELDNPEGEYAAALLGLMTAACMVAGGGPLCALLPAIFGPFFSAAIDSEYVQEAVRIVSDVSEGEPLTDADYSFLSDRGAAAWALTGLYRLQHGTAVSPPEINGNGVVEDSRLILETLLSLSAQRPIACDDIAEIVGDKNTSLTSKEREKLMGSILRPRWAMSGQAAQNIRRCVERFFIRQ